MTETFAMAWAFSLLGLMAAAFVFDMLFGPVLLVHFSLKAVIIFGAAYGAAMVGPIVVVSFKES